MMSDSPGGGNIGDEDLDVLIDAMSNMKKPEGNDVDERTIEQQLEDLDNHPAFMKEWDPSKPMSSEMEALMSLKYEGEDPTARAEAYKDDGNYEFQKKHYRIALDNYTEGITCKCPDKLLNAILYTNRAAANFHLENLRTSLNDCIFARKFKPDHYKAIHRGAYCCLQMKKYEECFKWCDDALSINPKDAKILEIRQKATKIQKSNERDKRKEDVAEKRELSKDLKLIQAIQKRGITMNKIKKIITDQEDLSPGLLESIETHNPHGAKVHLDTNGIVYWPVMFLYPEYTETDYIQMFCENQRIIDHISHIFGAEAEPAPWDRERHYKPHIINVYFEDRDKEKLHKVNKESTLLKVLQHKRYVVYGGTPAFILTVAGSDFEKDFLEKYKD